MPAVETDDDMTSPNEAPKLMSTHTTCTRLEAHNTWLDTGDKETHWPSDCCQIQYYSNWSPRSMSTGRGDTCTCPIHWHVTDLCDKGNPFGSETRRRPRLMREVLNANGGDRGNERRPRRLRIRLRFSWPDDGVCGPFVSKIKR